MNTTKMIDKDSYCLLKSLLTQEKVNYAELYAEEVDFLHILYEDKRVEPISTGKDKGYGLRFFRADEVYYFSTNKLDKLKPLTEQVLGKEITIRLNTKTSPEWVRKKHILVQRPETISLDKKITLLKNVEEYIRKISNEIQQVSLNYGEKIKNVWFINTENKAYIEERVYIVFSIDVVARRGSLIQTASEIIGGITGWELFEGKQSSTFIKQLANRVGKRALAKLSAPEAPVGEMPVILTAQAGGTMIHEAVGHSLEADSVQKGISPVYAGKINQSVANELITVIDDPTLANKNGSYIFDDEGVPAEKTVLIENGILKNYLYDRYTATKDKCSSNAHGRRESYHCKPIPRMSNTYILPGKDDPKKIIHSVENGLLVKKMGGGQVNTATGDFVFEVEEGYLIKNGQVGPLVRGAVLLGNGPEVLKSIDMVGNDLGWSIGICGKDGQGVPVSDGLPTLRIKKLVVGGTKG